MTGAFGSEPYGDIPFGGEPPAVVARALVAKGAVTTLAQWGGPKTRFEPLFTKGGGGFKFGLHQETTRQIAKPKQEKPKRDFAAEIQVAFNAMVRIAEEQARIEAERARLEAFREEQREREVALRNLERIDALLAARQEELIALRLRAEELERLRIELEILRKKRQEEEELAIVIAFMASH